MKKFKNESNSKSFIKTTIFIMIFLMTIGFSTLSITKYINGRVSLGFNFDDVNIYIANLFTNNINRFNSISEDKKSFSIDIEPGTTSIDYYVANNSTQYDEYISLSCNNDTLTGVTITPDENNSNIIYSQIINESTIIVNNEGENQTLICNITNLESETTNKTINRKKVIFALDGFELVTPYKYITSSTYDELPVIELDGYDFLGWYNSNDELVESTTEITTFTDEVLYGKLEENTCDYSPGQVWNFDYTGGEQTFTVPCNGTYKLETWGAQGGNINDTYYGGYGGYSSGNVSLNESSTISVVVGGKGSITTVSNCYCADYGSGGYNGGGQARVTMDENKIMTAGGGGGATHIALELGLLSSFYEKQDKVLIVSGGGGGAYYTSRTFYGENARNSAGGHAGGFTGESKTFADGGTQKSGYQFGIGAPYNTIQTAGGGGGAGWYGGNHTLGEASTDSSKSFSLTGAGGSGYIGNLNLTNKAMYCFNCATSNVESTKTISTTCTSATPTENCAKQGNGYARITLIKAKNPKIKVTIKGDNITLDKTTINNYYEDNEFTVTPAKGYYLSNITCTNDFIVSGYNTGINAYGTQTIKLDNNDSKTDTTCTVQAELLCRITNGTGTNLGDIVTCGSESFHIYNIGSTSIKALAKYPLHVSGTYNTNTKVFTAYTNPTGKQDTMFSSGGVLRGATAFSNSSSSYSGSLAQSYVNDYFNILNNSNISFNSVSLLQKSEVDTLFDKTLSTEYLPHENYKTWLNIFSYWLGTANGLNQVWVMGGDNSINGTFNYLGTSGNGGSTKHASSPFSIRPTISLNKDMIKYN